MSYTFEGGCAHIRTHSDHAPIDNHICHGAATQHRTGQAAAQVAYFNHDELVVENIELVERQPFDVEDSSNPLVFATCRSCGAPIMIGDQLGRIRGVIPTLMGYAPGFPAPTYHANRDPAAPAPDDGLPAHAGLRPDFVWPPTM
ncbi:hypothetical protein AAG895_02130 [Thauera sp. JM12B12]|uniref:GFA family protein n=1 Tax=Thauera sp. JM12B12 TaxID=3142262 RepID=UPI0031F440E6